MDSIDVAIEILKANGYRYSKSWKRMTYCYTGYSKDDKDAINIEKWDGETVRMSIFHRDPEILSVWRSWTDPRNFRIDLRDPNSIDKIVGIIGMAE